MIHDSNFWIKEGYQELQTGNYATALILFDKALILDPENAKAWNGRGAALYLYNLSSIQEEISVSNHTLAIAFYERGKLLEHEGLYQQAIKSYDRVLAIKPDFDKARESRSNALTNLQSAPPLSFVLQRPPTPKHEFSPSTVASNLYPQPNYAESEKYRQAVEELYAGRFKVPIADTEQALALDPENIAAWNRLVTAFQNTGRIDKVIASFNQVIAITRGLVIENLRVYQEAVSIFNQAILLELKDPCAYSVRGNALRKLGHYEEAISAYNEALRLQSYNYLAYNGRGNTFKKLGRYQEAMDDFNTAIQLQNDCHVAYCNRGDVLRKLERYEEAIDDFNRAIRLESNNYLAYNGRGNARKDLESYEEAIYDYNEAIRLQPNNHLSYNNRGAALRKLGLLHEAISDFNQALQLSRNQNWRAWVNLGWTYFQNLEHYAEAFRIWEQGLQELGRLLQHQPQNPEYQRGCGELNWCKGKAYYRYGRLQHKPYDSWIKAHESYELAFKILTFEQLPERHLEVWQDLLQVSQQLKPFNQVQQLLSDATDLLRRLLVNQIDSEKIRLSRKFAGFDEIGVDIAVQSGNWCAALELAEKRKNVCLAWLRGEMSDALEGSFNYAQIQNLLNPRTAVIYWHLSPSALTTFILKKNSPPLAWMLKPDPNILRLSQLPDTEQQFSVDNLIRPETIDMLNKFEKWLSRWKSKYESTRKNSKDVNEKAGKGWRETMPEELKKLAKILDIERITKHLGNIDQLILIPHRDLHLLPLDSLFLLPVLPDAITDTNKPKIRTITRLPSAQIGIQQQQQTPTEIAPNSMLMVHHSQGKSELKYTQIEAAAISQINQTNRTSNATTKTEIIEALKTNSGIFHYTGHAYHNTERSENSALVLGSGEELTLTDILHLKLVDYYLVCLSACETGITKKSGLIDEFVGIASGFLPETNYVISTLWRVDERSSALLLIYFYQLWKQGMQPPEALQQAKDWLRELTNGKLGEWYASELLPLLREADFECKIHILFFFEREASRLKKKLATIRNERPYKHPYHWAAFTITGNG